MLPFAGRSERFGGWERHFLGSQTFSQIGFQHANDSASAFCPPSPAACRICTCGSPRRSDGLRGPVSTIHVQPRLWIRRRPVRSVHVDLLVGGGGVRGCRSGRHLHHDPLPFPSRSAGSSSPPWSHGARDRVDARTGDDHRLPGRPVGSGAVAGRDAGARQPVGSASDRAPVVVGIPLPGVLDRHGRRPPPASGSAGGAATHLGRRHSQFLATAVGWEARHALGSHQPVGVHARLRG